jgi:hypothetical protein
MSLSGMLPCVLRCLEGKSTEAIFDKLSHEVLKSDFAFQLGKL